MKVFQVEADDEVTARTKLAADLGVKAEQLRCVETKNKKFGFEALELPPKVEFEISRDKMRAKLKKIRMPIGESVPKLTTQFVVDALKGEGVVHGILHEKITEELFRVCSLKNFDENRPLSVVVAEGQAPEAAQAGRPQWILDLRLFKKSKPVFCRKSEVIAKAPIAIKGKPGKNIFGEEIAFQVDDPFRLPIGSGIKIEQKGNEFVYVAESCGQLFLDQGVRVRLEVKILDLEEGLAAGMMLGEKTFAGRTFLADELLQAAKDNGVTFGLLSPQEVTKQLLSVKKWPAVIILARGEDSVDGQAGQVEFYYQTPKSDALLDRERAKEKIVFPGEIIARIKNAIPPKDGKTVFGETLRGRPYTEMPIYPGKNIQKEREGDDDIFRSRIYGKVQRDAERIHIENLVSLDPEAKKVSLDLFPQELLSPEQVISLLRDKDVLFGYDKERIEAELQQIHKSGKRTSVVLARAKEVKPGRNAKLRYYFRPDDLKEKGLIVKSKPKWVYAVPGDLILEKFIPIEAEDGTNLYRERIEAPKEVQAKDVEIKVGKWISEKEVGQYGNESDPARIQYRATSFGLVQWKNRELSLQTVIEIDDNEEYFKMKLAPQSDFGTPLRYELIEKFAQEEGVRVELERAEIMKALTTRPPEGALNDVIVAKSIPSQNGQDAKIEYSAQFNGEPIEEWLQTHKPANPEVLFADCMRPKEVVATKTPAGNGVDGKTVFGRRIIAERGNDEPWMLGWGLEKSSDGNALVVGKDAPGFLVIEDRRLTIRNTLRLSADKMTASMWIYPSKSARFQPREDKILAMLQAKGVCAGIKIDDIRAAISDVIANQTPVEVVVAEGVPAGVGKNSQYRLAFESDQAGLIREDGSIDYKAGSVFHMVRAEQLLMVKQNATQGPDGFNVLDERIPGQYGVDQKVQPGAGVKVSANGLEFHASIDGILEISENSIRVMEGLLISSDVDYSTGSITAGAAKVLIRGSVLPGFSVSSESDIVVDQVAEACQLNSKTDIRVNGGVIGKEKAHIFAEGKIEALYINSGALVEAGGDIIGGSEVLNSRVRTGGTLVCERGAGTISGGEIWAYEGIKARMLGAPGAETPTRIYLGVNYLELQAAEKRLHEEGLIDKERELTEELRNLDKELKLLYDEIPAASEAGHEEASKLQEQYKGLYEFRRQVQADLETVGKQKMAILSKVPRNKDVKVQVIDTAHPGVVLIYKDVEWELKEPLKSVQITWNEGAGNFNIRRV